MVNFKDITAIEVKKVFGQKTTRISLENDYKELKKHRKEIFRKAKVSDVLNEIKKYRENKAIVEKALENHTKDVMKITTKEGNTLYYTINDKLKTDISDVLKKGFIRNSTKQSTYGSDAQILSLISHDNINDIEIIEEMPDDYNEKRSGGFFKYYHVLDFDFSRYGIYKDFDEDNYQENCLVYSLRTLGMDKTKIDKLKFEIRNSTISMCNLKNVCEMLDIKIIIRYIREDENRLRIIKYGSNDNEVYELCLIDDHYFIYDTTNITSYAINNYFDICDEERFNEIWIRKGKYYERTKKRFIKSSDAVKLLLENKDKLLTKIKLNDDIMNTPYYHHVEQKIDSLMYMPNDCHEYIKKNNKFKDEKETFIVFFDFETSTVGDVHIPYMVHFCSQNENETHELIGYDQNLGAKFLQKVIDYYHDEDEKIVLIAHNMRYDLSFISSHLMNFTTVEAGNKIIQAKGRFNSVDFTIKDSYAIISTKLSQFNKMFELGDIKKEIINYDLYNDYVGKINFDNDDDHLLNIDETVEKYYTKNADEFINNINEWNIVYGDKFDFIKYASYYCSKDVLTLKAGYFTFRKWIKKLYKIDIVNKCSISGIADEVLKNAGCYEGCYSFSGVIRKFISSAVVGGRTMSANNEKNIIGNRKLNFNTSTAQEEINEMKKLNQNISDFDGVSLYPSSMSMIKGFIKGMPKVFDNNMTYQQLQTYDYYYVEILIKSVGKFRNFPLMSMMDDEGVRNFTNGMIGETIIIDKIGLEDAIEFQNIEFDIVRGYYFNDGFNDRINRLINTMFNERKKNKKNPIEVVYKLLMNAAYGKTILKESECSKKYFNTQEEAFKFMIRNYNTIIETRQLYNDNKYIVKYRDEICTHSNYCHIGAMILSMSKRIMNQVICTAEDNNIQIFYQDTDSMHLFDNDIQKLTEKYEEKYGKTLIGENLGQFHTDFKMKHEEKDDDGNKIDLHTRSKLCIILGKKCYLDVLGCDNKNVYECHARLKGIPENTMLYTAKKLYNHNLDAFNIIHLYCDLYDGKEIEFDLTNEGNSIKMEMFDLTVRTNIDFKRSLKF